MAEVFGIKLWDGIELNVDGKTEVFDSPCDACEAINIKGDLYKDVQIEITRRLMSAGVVDLSEFYPGHMIVLTKIVNE